MILFIAVIVLIAYPPLCYMLLGLLHSKEHRIIVYYFILFVFLNHWFFYYEFSFDFEWQHISDVCLIGFPIHCFKERVYCCWQMRYAFIAVMYDLKMSFGSVMQFAIAAFATSYSIFKICSFQSGFFTADVTLSKFNTRHMFFSLFIILFFLLYEL